VNDCPHELWERESDVTADGSCPICLRAKIERLNTALKIAGENIVVVSEKCNSFTQAMLKAMALIDELIRENGRLCAASDQPPDVRLFAAKNSFDTAMKKLLGEQP
jgi:hypothetical protein